MDEGVTDAATDEAGVEDATTTGVLEAATEAATEDGVTDAATDEAIDEGTRLEVLLDTAGVLLWPDELLGTTTGAELCPAELLFSSIGTPITTRVSRKWVNACCTDTTEVVTEPELATRLVTAGEAAN